MLARDSSRRAFGRRWHTVALAAAVHPNPPSSRGRVGSIERALAIPAVSSAVREGLPLVGFLTALALLLGRWNRGVATALLALAGFCLLFFRDPPRHAPDNPLAIVAAADGRILRIDRVEHEPFVGGPCIRLVTFLSLFDVHVNRSPVTGTIRLLERRRGGFGPTFDVERSDRNAAEIVGIEGTRGRLVVRRTAGLVARRIVTWVSPMESVVAGQKLGMLKFGSRTDLLLAEGKVTITVKEGDHVRAGSTVVARYRA